MYLSGINIQLLYLSGIKHPVIVSVLHIFFLYRILGIIETAAESIPLLGNESHIITLRSFAVAVTKVDLSQDFFGQIISTEFRQSSIPSNDTIDPNAIHISQLTDDSPSTLGAQTTSLAIPKTVFERSESLSNNTRITNSIFFNDFLFSRRNTSATRGLVVGSIIMAASLNNRSINNLSLPVRLSFLKKSSLEDGTDPTCTFWDFSADGKINKMLMIFFN